MKKLKRLFLLGLAIALGVFITGFIIPGAVQMPVQGAGKSSYNPNSYWAHPWGKSVTHKGVDIFANKGTPVLAATGGVVTYCGPNGRGGNVVLVMGPKWRVHYYAHLDEIAVKPHSWVSQGEQLGTVGNTGNAADKPPHLHYAIITMVPYPWRADDSPQGKRKMYYLNPIEHIENPEVW